MTHDPKRNKSGRFFWGEFLLESSGWLLLALLCLAPMAVGGVTWWGFLWIILLGGVVSLMGLSGVGLQWQEWKWGVSPPDVCLMGLMIQGWWMCWNAHSYYDSDKGVLVATTPRWSGAPGAVDAETACYEMAAMTSLVGVFWLTRRLQRQRVWRRRIWRACLFAGGGVLVVGLTQKLEGVDVYASQHPPREGTPFGPFSYHANAAAYINLVLGLALAWAICRFRVYKDKSLAGPAVMIAACLLGVMAAGSRGGMLIAAMLLFGVAVIGFVFLFRRGQLASTVVSILKRDLFVVVMLALVFVVSWNTLGGREALERWRQTRTQLSEGSGRIKAWRSCWPLMAEAGWTGHGPGAMKLLLPHAPTGEPMPIHHGLAKPHQPGTRVSMWNQLHQDYLQTWIEWGGLGFAFWFILFGGGIAGAVFRLYKASEWMAEYDWCFLLGCCLALGGVCVHAAFDFPLQIASIRLYVAVLLGCVWGIGAWEQKEEDGAES
jgi:O-antigen ligase